jgi:hypothetical protein
MFKVGDLLSIYMVGEHKTALILSVGQVYQGGILTTIYTVLSTEGDILKYPDYVIRDWKIISKAAA